MARPDRRSSFVRAAEALQDNVVRSGPVAGAGYALIGAILLLGGLVVVAISQRANITKCAKDIRAEYASGNGTRTTCRFFGYSFTVSNNSGIDIDPNLGRVTTEP